MKCFSLIPKRKRKRSQKEELAVDQFRENLERYFPGLKDGVYPVYAKGLKGEYKLTVWTEKLFYSPLPSEKEILLKNDYIIISTTN